MIDVLVLGAGVSGLSCARQLARAGRSVVVVDKGRGVGGRCATRRIDGRPVDHGAPWLHGQDPAFLEELAGLEGIVPDWPARRAGEGFPCQPTALATRRIGVRSGVAALPKKLAQGLDVRLGVTVTRMEARPEGIAALVEGAAGPLVARDVVLTFPVEQARALLDASQLAGAGPIEASLRLLGTVPALMVIAWYGPEVPAPDIDLWLPSEGPLQMITNDARLGRGGWSLVAQMRPSESRARLEAAPEAWAAEVLAEVGRVVGRAYATPAGHQAHRWRYARSPAPGANGPVVLDVAGGRLAVAGEAYHPAGGIEGAWSSGREAARRLIGAP